MISSPRRTRAALALAAIVAVAVTSSAGVGTDATSALEVPTPGITGFHEGVYVPIDDLLVGEQGDASIVANGDLAVTWAGSHFEGTVDGDESARVVRFRRRVAWGDDPRAGRHDGR